MPIDSYITLMNIQKSLHHSIGTILAISNAICCMSVTVTIYCYAASALHDSLQEFFF